MIRSLLRNFENDCPAEILTGLPKLDTYLLTLDQQLLGPRATRTETVLEVKDHLLEAYHEHTSAGDAAALAQSKALDSMGAPEMISGPQRKHFLFTLARSIVFQTLYFAVVIGIFHRLLSGDRFHLDFFQAFLVAVMTVLIDHFAIPSPLSCREEEIPKNFDVHARGRTWYFAFALFLSTVQILTILKLRAEHWDVREIAQLCIALFFIALTSYVARFRIRVGIDGLWIRRITGSEFVAPSQWIDATETTTKTYLSSLLGAPAKRYWILRFRARGKVQNVTILRDYVNGRRLKKTVEKWIQEQAKKSSA